MIPQITNGISEQIRFIPYASRTYRYTEENLSGYTDGREAVKQAIYHILSIERFSHAIYDDNYGSQMEQYIGKSFEFMRETIQNTLSDALLQDDRITGVTVTNVEKQGITSALVEFAVTTTEGTIEGMGLSVQL